MDRPFLMLSGTLAVLTFGGTLFALQPGAVAITEAEDANALGYLSDCRTAHALGAVNIRRGEPGYRPALDADGDGLACEAVLADGQVSSGF